ncbi:MAG: PP2C family protein-serine/threonine phosphatase [Cryomorphaceae bacterium]|nr:serine/threonine-protein phosphatase [Flavobacteriales bacterium]
MQIERLKERLKVRDFKLKSLLEITQSINEYLDTESLLDQFRDILENRLQIRRLILFSKIEGEWKCAIRYGTDSVYSNVNVEDEFAEIDSIKIVQSDDSTFFRDFDLVIPVFHENRPLAFVLIGDIDGEEIKVSPIIKHMRFIQTLANIISVAIENRELFAKSLEQERTHTELKLAAEMQSLLVGTGKKDFKNFEVATYYKPHQQVGGDFCDFIEINENEAFFCVADVSGKGISAAFLMANIQSHLRALLKYTDWTLESVAHELNDKVIETVNGDKFVTVFMGYFNTQTRELRYLNAGHNPPVLYNNGKTHLLESGSVGIGMLPSLPFVEEGMIELQKNAVIVCYTDGLVEIENENQEEFGYDRLGNLIQKMEAESPHVDDLISHIIRAMDMHRGSVPYFDDTALISCRFR